MLILLAAAINSTACGAGNNRDRAAVGSPEKKAAVPAEKIAARSEPRPSNQAAVQIVDLPIKSSAAREQLTKEYSQLHYGTEQTVIAPQAVVVHWTGAPTFQSTYAFFYPESRVRNGRLSLNVASHFLVDRDGRICRLTPETALNRHAIGYNWCAIGIENVGGTGGREDLTEAQLQADIGLIRYLKEKYPAIKYVWGHYQQDQAKASGLFREKVSGYRTEKVDPGPKFMRGLHQALAGEDLFFYPE